MRSGRMSKPCGPPGARTRTAASCEASEVYARQRPAKKAAATSFEESITTGFTASPRAAKTSARRCSCVVPFSTQIVAPFNSASALMPADFAHHERLPVVEQHAGKLDPQQRLARERPGGVASQQVDSLRLQGRKARRGLQRHELHLLRIAQYGGCHGAAEIRVHPAPASARVRFRKARDALAHAAAQQTARLDAVERLARLRRRDQQHGAHRQYEVYQ